MLRRANQLVDRARERIRLAAERDPHSWPERDDDRSILVRNGAGTAAPEGTDHDVNPADPDADPDDDPDVDAHVGRAGDGTGAALANGRGDLDSEIAGGDDRPALGSPAAGAPELDNSGRV